MSRGCFPDDYPVEILRGATAPCPAQIRRALRLRLAWLTQKIEDRVRAAIAAGADYQLTQDPLYMELTVVAKVLDQNAKV